MAEQSDEIDATCPDCQSNRVMVTEGSTWGECRDCAAAWNYGAAEVERFAHLDKGRVCERHNDWWWIVRADNGARSTRLCGWEHPADTSSMPGQEGTP